MVLSQLLYILLLCVIKKYHVQWRLLVFQRGEALFSSSFFKTRLSGVGMVKRARTRCWVDGLYFIDKKTKKQTRGI